MKLLAICSDPNLFDPASEVARRQIELAQKWEELYLLNFSMPGGRFVQLSPNCFVIPTNSVTKFGRAFDAIRIGRRLIPEKGITHVKTQDPFLTGLVGEALKKRCHISLDVEIHTDIGSPMYSRSIGNKIRLHIAHFVLPKADTIRVVSNKIKVHLVEKLGIKESKITVRPIPVDTEKIRNAPVTVDLHKKYPQFSHIVLMASRLEPEKQIPLAITAFAQVRESYPQAGLLIVGKGSQVKILEHKIAQLGLGNAVVIEPWVDQATLASYYKTADLFLVTSEFEGYGMTLAEAHAAGCPLVSTDVGIAREVDAAIVEHSASSIGRGIMYTLENSPRK